MTLSNIAQQPLDQLGALLFTAYENFKGSAPIQYAFTADKYYDLENDILDTRIMFVNDEGQLVEDETATNTKIAHGFFPELVDQKVQYILGDEGIEVCPADEENTQLAEYLADYFNDDWQLTMQELIEGASVKGFEGMFARTTAANVLRFQVADSTRLVPVFDDFGQLVRVLRYYSEQRYSEAKLRTVTVQHCDVWDEKEVAYYIQSSEGDATNFILDPTREINPAPHVVARALNPDYIEGESDESEHWLPLGRSYGAFPFHILHNNRQGSSDLKPIKDKIDDYDVMNCFMSNNLQDMTEAFYVVKGYSGTNITELRQNIKSRKAVSLAPTPDAGVDIKTYNIPVEGRAKKMELDEVNIYRSGMGFNSQQLGDGNITNVVIKSRYTLLAMKASKLIARLKACLKWQAQLVCEDIALRYGAVYTPADIEFKIEPQAIVNESDLIKDEQVKQQTKNLEIQGIMQAAPRLGDEYTLRGLCEIFELDFEEVQKNIEEEEEKNAALFGENNGNLTPPDPEQFLPQNNPQSAAAAAAGQEDENVNQ